MSRYKEHYINSENNFIGGWYMSPDLCQSIINAANKKAAFFSEVTNYYVYRLLNQLDKSLYDEYISQLTEITKLYTEKYPRSLDGSHWRFTTTKDEDEDNDTLALPLIKFQKYFPNRSYYTIHCENDGTDERPVCKNRHLVFMTYLNSLKEGGETEFTHQNFKCKPNQGLTLIWPAHWTHMHRGLPSAIDTKYILTGWFIRDSKLKFNNFQKSQ